MFSATYIVNPFHLFGEQSTFFHPLWYNPSHLSAATLATPGEGGIPSASIFRSSPFFASVRPFPLCSPFSLAPNLSVTVKSSPLARCSNPSLGCGDRCGDGGAAMDPGRRGLSSARMQGDKGPWDRCAEDAWVGQGKLRHCRGNRGIDSALAKGGRGVYWDQGTVGGLAQGWARGRESTAGLSEGYTSQNRAPTPWGPDVKHSRRMFHFCNMDVAFWQHKRVGANCSNMLGGRVEGTGKISGGEPCCVQRTEMRKGTQR